MMSNKRVTKVAKTKIEIRKRLTTQNAEDQTNDKQRKTRENKKIAVRATKMVLGIWFPAIQKL